MQRILACWLIILALTPAAWPQAEEPKAKLDKSVEQLAEACKKSVVVITVTGRTGKREGLGTGFVLSKDGLIATNLHVIGEARPIEVQLSDGGKHAVTEVHATDRSRDLAIVRIAAKELQPLELGDSDQLRQGSALVALGNPQGLEHSVVAGVLSGRRDIDGRSMLQIAMPVEPGNSGGPVVDARGRVQGIVTLKSAVTANLGFAVPINDLKPLLAKPNPVALERWLTIGQIDGEEWEPLFGARWRQRAGRIMVDQMGAGFGGRALLLSKTPPPELPYEMAVSVKLGDESGAAGLAFCGDGNQKHYGFYPSSGGLRLTRFEGPDVFTWKVLDQTKTEHYQPGQWNTIKVRVEKDKLLCWCNDQLVFESTDREFVSGRLGLVKFRDTTAEFKNLRIGKSLGAAAVPAEVRDRVAKLIAEPLKPDLAAKLVPDGDVSLQLLRDRARLLEEQATQLRQLAQQVYRQRIMADLIKSTQGKDADIDLVHAALQIAKLDNDDLDVDAYRQEVERMGRKIAATLAKDADDAARLAALNKFLFTDRGFHGSRGDYYNRSNSYLNEVIDDREGLPITLSLLYIELGKRIGLRLAGVPLPGHFMVRTVPAEGEGTLIDVYGAGAVLTRAEAAKKVESTASIPLQEEHLKPALKRDILIRILHNLINVARQERDGPKMLQYLDAIIGIDPKTADERWTRAVLRAQAGQVAEARADIDWLLEHKWDGIEQEKILEFRRLLEKMER